MQLKLLWKVRIVAFVFVIVSFLAPCAALAKNVYESQTPITDQELVKFIQILPQFRAWATSNKEQAQPQVVKGKADFTYSGAARQWVQARSWDARRFFNVMGKAAAALYILSEGQQATRPRDMPSVSQAELDIVQKHLTKLLEASRGGAAPMKQ